MNIGQIFIESHRSAWDLVLRRLPAVLVLTVVAVATSLATHALHTNVSNAIADQLLEWLVQLACLWITAPATVSVFRYLVLGEIVSANPLARTHATGAYFNGAALISLISLIALLVHKIPQWNVASGGPAALIPMSGAFVAVAVALVRITTYLPGLAVGREGNSLSLALKETQGRFFFIVGTYLVAVGPALLVSILVFSASRTPWLYALLMLPVSSALVLLTLSATALLYRMLKRDEAVPVATPSRAMPASTGPRRAFGRLSYSAPDLSTQPQTDVGLTLMSRIRAAYVDLVNIVREMWPVLLILTAIYFVCAMAWFFAPTLVGTWVGRMIMRMLIFIGIAWFAAPFYVSLHRFIATGEVRWIPPFGNYDVAGRVYFGWAGMTVALWFMPLILGDVAEAFGRYGVLVELIGFVVILCVLPRMTTLLPAAALDPQSATWAQAMDDSRGRAWSFFASTTLGALPAIIALTLLGQAAGAKTIEPVPFFALAVPSLLVLQLIPLAIGTRLYLGATRRGPSIDRMQQVIRPR